MGYASRVVDGLFRVVALHAVACRAMLRRQPRWVTARSCCKGTVMSITAASSRRAAGSSSSIGSSISTTTGARAFSGANDHEADWEMVCIYLAPNGQDELHPEWVAFASHDYQGDDLRRRWDDPEVQKAGDHPVIYAGAGSHASYFTAGEYLTEIELNVLAPVTRRPRWSVCGSAPCRKNLTRGASDAAHAGGSVLAIPLSTHARRRALHRSGAEGSVGIRLC